MKYLMRKKGCYFKGSSVILLLHPIAFARYSCDIFESFREISSDYLGISDELLLHLLTSKLANFLQDAEPAKRFNKLDNRNCVGARGSQSLDSTS